MTGAAAEATLDAAGVGLGSHVLDVGTGPGTLIGPALERGATVIALDLTEEMINQVRQRFPDVEARIGNASDLPFYPGPLDAVTLGFCVHHIAEPPAPGRGSPRAAARWAGRVHRLGRGGTPRCDRHRISALAEVGLEADDAAAATPTLRTAAHRKPRPPSNRPGSSNPSPATLRSDGVCAAPHRSSTASNDTPVSPSTPATSNGRVRSRCGARRWFPSRLRRHHLPSEPRHPRCSRKPCWQRRPPPDRTAALLVMSETRGSSLHAPGHSP